MAVIIFDLVGTLITKEKQDYRKALKWLALNYFDNRYKELENLSQNFKVQYMSNRKNSYTETSFLNQLSTFEKNLNVHLYEDYQNIEWQFVQIFRREQLADGAIELLKFLSENDYSIFVFTNSLFSGNSLKQYLNGLGIGKYIEKIYSSADIGFRKPAREAFNFVLKSIGIDNPCEVRYVGDSYEKDYIGALESGLNPVLLSSIHNIPGKTFDNINALLDYFRKLH